MNCPFCDQEMIEGRAGNSTMHAVDLVFKKEHEKFRFQDIVSHDNRIYARVIAGHALEAYYCDKCEKITMISDRTNSAETP